MSYLPLGLRRYTEYDDGYGICYNCIPSNKDMGAFGKRGGIEYDVNGTLKFYLNAFRRTGATVNNAVLQKITGLKFQHEDGVFFPQYDETNNMIYISLGRGTVPAYPSSGQKFSALAAVEVAIGWLTAMSAHGRPWKVDQMLVNYDKIDGCMVDDMIRKIANKNGCDCGPNARQENCNASSKLWFVSPLSITSTGSGPSAEYCNIYLVAALMFVLIHGDVPEAFRGRDAASIVVQYASFVQDGAAWISSSSSSSSAFSEPFLNVIKGMMNPKKEVFNDYARAIAALKTVSTIAAMRDMMAAAEDACIGAEAVVALEDELAKFAC